MIRLFFVFKEDEKFELDFNLKYKEFSPTELTISSNPIFNKYERYATLINREIKPYLNYNKEAKIINFEIVPKFPYKTRRVLLSNIRIYFDGSFNDPPGEKTQEKPIPKQETSVC